VDARAVLARGQPWGAKVVVTGAAEIFGTEFGIREIEVGIGGGVSLQSFRFC
jgi:hypothetical protein